MGDAVVNGWSVSVPVFPSWQGTSRTGRGNVHSWHAGSWPQCGWYTSSADAHKVPFNHAYGTLSCVFSDCTYTHTVTLQVLHDIVCVSQCTWRTTQYKAAKSDTLIGHFLDRSVTQSKVFTFTLVEKFEDAILKLRCQSEKKIVTINPLNNILQL